VLALGLVLGLATNTQLNKAAVTGRVQLMGTHVDSDGLAYGGAAAALDCG